MMHYSRPQTTAEAETLLGQWAGAQALAGGHDLIPAMKSRARSPAMLVDLEAIPPTTHSHAVPTVTVVCTAAKIGRR